MRDHPEIATHQAECEREQEIKNDKRPRLSRVVRVGSKRPRRSGSENQRDYEEFVHLANKERERKQSSTGRRIGARSASPIRNNQERHLHMI